MTTAESVSQLEVQTLSPRLVLADSLVLQKVTESCCGAAPCEIADKNGVAEKT